MTRLVATPDTPDTKGAKRILAFDFGTHRIGVAFGQSLTGTATPLAPIQAKDGIPDWTLLGQLIEQWKPDTFVVGIPLNMDGTDNDITVRARKFMRRLHGRFHKPSYGMDERLSTFDAKSEIMSDTQGSTKNTSVDSLAATLILESWFRQATD